MDTNMVDRLLLPDQRGHDFFKARDFFFRNRNTGTGFGEELLISGLGDVGLIDLFLEGTVVPVKAAVTDVRGLLQLFADLFFELVTEGIAQAAVLAQLILFPGMTDGTDPEPGDLAFPPVDAGIVSYPAVASPLGHGMQFNFIRNS
jgi:hypothetical protein